MSEIRIEIPQFITHVAKSKNSYIKISGQAIYSGMNYFLRSKIVNGLHKYLGLYITPDMKIKTPVSLRAELYAPENFGEVRRSRKGYLMWKKPPGNYQPAWDIDNYSYIWCKCFADTLVLKGVLPDDNVKIVRGSGGMTFHPVDHIDKRKLIFIIKSLENDETS